MTVLVDSDILIEVMRGRNVEIISRWTSLGKPENLAAYSPVTLAELWAGVRKSEYAALEGLFAAIVCLNADKAIGRLAGHYVHQYGKSHGVETADALIAATAVEHKAALWTRNYKHYPMKEVMFWRGPGS